MSPWFLLAGMSLATFILTKLVVDLDFPPVLWVRDRVIGGWRPLTTAEAANLADVPARRTIDGEGHRYVERKSWIPLFFADLISCPWCTSGWIALGTVGCTWLAVGLPVPVLMWFAVWALGALLAQHDWS
jgi:hypothetical protein